MDNFTVEHLADLVNQICEHMEYPTPKVVINNRFSTRTIARASWGGTEDRSEMIEFNKATLNFKIEDLISLIRHEVMHLITKRGDNEPEFQMACRINNIPQNGDGTKFEGVPKKVEKYFPICTSCGTIHKAYQRKSKHVVGIMTTPKLYCCGHCKEYGTLFIEERN